MRSLLLWGLRLLVIFVSFPALLHAEESNLFAPGIKVVAAVNATAYDWSPEGSLFAYVAPDGVKVVQRPNFNTPIHLVRKAYCAAGSCPGSEILWSPDGKKLAFSDSRAGDGNSSIWTVNADGSHVQDLLSADAPFVYVGRRAVSINTWLDNETLTFEQHCGTGCVALHSATPSGPSRYKTFGVTSINMSNPPKGYGWSPRKDRAIVATHSGGLGLVRQKDAKRSTGGLPDDVQSVVGGCRVSYVPAPGSLEGAVHQFDDWSPDGLHVLYTSWSCSGSPGLDSSPILYLWNVDRNQQKLLVKNAGWSTWSPDGAKIAFLLLGKPRYDRARHIVSTDFVVEKPFHFYVGVIDATKKVKIGLISLGDKAVELQALGFDLERFRPHWSPDSRQLALTDTNNNVFVVRADGTGRRAITLSGAAKLPALEKNPVLKMPWKVVWAPDGKHLSLWDRTGLFDDNPPGFGRFLPPTGRDDAMLTDAEVIRRYFLKMLGEEKDLGGVFLYQYLEFLTLSVDQLEEQGKRKESQAYLCQRVAELVHVEVKFELRTDTEVHSELQELSTACLQRRRERREISYPERWRGARAIRTTRAQDPVGQRHLQSRPSLYIVEAPPIGEEETSHSISLPALPVQ